MQSLGRGDRRCLPRQLLEGGSADNSPPAKPFSSDSQLFAFLAFRRHLESPEVGIGEGVSLFTWRHVVWEGDPELSKDKTAGLSGRTRGLRRLENGAQDLERGGLVTLPGAGRPLQETLLPLIVG